jgi:hypothetical protein
MCTPWDWSLIFHIVISISFSMGISFGNYDLIVGSKKFGIQGAGGLMKSPEDGSTHSIDSIPSGTFRYRSDPWPHSSRVVSFSSVYTQAGRARCWRGAMRFDKKSNSTIIDVKPFSTRNWILFNMGW